MDNSAIIFKLDIMPGSIVVEAGTGSGSLSCAISESIKEKGHLYTFEFNKERAEITKKFFEDLKKTNITSTWRDVVQNGFEIEGKNFKADALFLDVPNPWAAIHHTKRILKKCTHLNYLKLAEFAVFLRVSNKSKEPLTNSENKNSSKFEPSNVSADKFTNKTSP
jgi:tRNA A58 N-methylase Trm61